VRLDIENHHNFAWREKHVLPDGTEADVIVRKGATPAGAGVLGIIPGSMGTPGYVVRGRGAAAGLQSAPHGAGRRMSRTKAKETFSWKVAAAIPARTQGHAPLGRARRGSDGVQGLSRR
jgi:tRNA-splicing ligase RtcB